MARVRGAVTGRGRTRGGKGRVARARSAVLGPGRGFRGRAGRDAPDPAPRLWRFPDDPTDSPSNVPPRATGDQDARGGGQPAGSGASGSRSRGAGPAAPRGHRRAPGALRRRSGAGRVCAGARRQRAAHLLGGGCRGRWEQAAPQRRGRRELRVSVRASPPLAPRPQCPARAAAPRTPRGPTPRRLPSARRPRKCVLTFPSTPKPPQNPAALSPPLRNSPPNVILGYLHHTASRHRPPHAARPLPPDVRLLRRVLLGGRVGPPVP